MVNKDSLSLIQVLKHFGKKPLQDRLDMVTLPSIMEGLIKTYPEAEVLGVLHRKFNVQILKSDYRNWVDLFCDFDVYRYDGAVWIKPSRESQETNRIVVCTATGDYNVLVLDKTMQACGYFCIAHTSRPVKYNGVDYVLHTFEKKFDKDITDEVLEHRYIYHICREKVVPKILKKGLSARTSEHWDGFSNPERVYFFLNKLNDTDFRLWAMHFRMGKGEEKDARYCMLEIDTKGLDEKFYIDPRLKGGIYCTNWISPKRIKVVDTI